MGEQDYYQRGRAIIDLASKSPDVDQEKLVKFAHWLNGYLSALDARNMRNKQLITIMEKFAEVYKLKTP